MNNGLNRSALDTRQHTFAAVLMTQWHRDFFQKFTVAYPVKKLSCGTRSHRPANGTYPETDKSSTHHHILFKIHYNIILPSTPRSSKWSVPYCVSG